jgi:hypothetical protein
MRKGDVKSLKEGDEKPKALTLIVQMPDVAFCEFVVTLVRQNIFFNDNILYLSFTPAVPAAHK